MADRIDELFRQAIEERVEAADDPRPFDALPGRSSPTRPRGLSEMNDRTNQRGLLIGAVALVAVIAGATFVALNFSRETDSTETAASGETILVVEDDSDVRRLAVTILEDLGYAVLEAWDGESARGVLATASSIELLLSDVVLPGGMSGPALALAPGQTAKEPTTAATAAPIRKPHRVVRELA